MACLNRRWVRLVALATTGGLSCATFGCLDPGAQEEAGVAQVAQVAKATTLNVTADDTDGDGLSDDDEIALGMDPMSADADGDGILDPSDLDLDNDGIPNQIECDAAALSLENGGFELPAIPAGEFQLIADSLVPGWSTTAGDQTMELWSAGFMGVPAADGAQFAELNANQASTLYQDVSTAPGQVYFYRFYHRGRLGDDTIAFSVGDPNGQLVKIREVTSGNMAWQLVTGTYAVPAGQTVSRFAYASVSASGGNNAVGNFLDGIAFTPGCGTDTDNDGTPDFRDMDSDGDGLLDGIEAGHGLAGPDGVVPGPYGTNGLADSVETPSDSGTMNYTVLDTDMDGTPNFQEVDSDDDGIDDGVDMFPLDPTESEDTDDDGAGDNVDNCPDVPNPDQADEDEDGMGDACEPLPTDADSDGVIDAEDNCPNAANPDQADEDKDGTGDACEPKPKGWYPAGDGCSCQAAGASTGPEGMAPMAIAGLLALAIRRRRTARKTA